MQILSWIYVVIAVVLLFGASVFVHEYGHFLVARWRGLKIEGFSIGFGPKIVSWTRQGIEYAWRWIPAGGFVKLPQMLTSEAIEGKRGARTAPARLPPVEDTRCPCRAHHEWSVRVRDCDNHLFRRSASECESGHRWPR